MTKDADQIYNEGSQRGRSERSAKLESRPWNCCSDLQERRKERQADYTGRMTNSISYHFTSCETILTVALSRVAPQTPAKMNSGDNSRSKVQSIRLDDGAEFHKVYWPLSDKTERDCMEEDTRSSIFGTT